ncbi:VOC family protein [Sphingomonas sp. SUN019]|uniref:VOC family protein n=1 Tax=Sphingomonas sp. SUN019 TaxID=2937788 RepID=UPI0021646B98|nr:VOC family protein [Sphingomonas sp. SUN019]UVO49635.1 VOC family protein [Sphingomonas sp. SUN019]
MANPNGTPIWFELTTDDQAKSKDFYASVMGWAIAPSPMDEHGDYLLANAADGEGVAGIMKPPPGMAGVPGWTIYFGVDDVDKQADAVKDAGGAVHFGPMDIPGVGRFATCADPQGLVFNIMRGNSPEDSTAFKQMAGDAGLGHGVWIELATPDPDAALGFYGSLFGWSKQGAMPMGPMGDYTFIGRSEADRPGAIMSSTTTNAPARWNMYFQVADIDAAIETAKQGGGTVTGPDEIPGSDYSANVTDPHGQQVGIVGPRK